MSELYWKQCCAYIYKRATSLLCAAERSLSCIPHCTTAYTPVHPIAARSILSLAEVSNAFPTLTASTRSLCCSLLLVASAGSALVYLATESILDGRPNSALQGRRLPSVSWRNDARAAGRPVLHALRVQTRICGSSGPGPGLHRRQRGERRMFNFAGGTSRQTCIFEDLTRHPRGKSA